jgi:hypothetical protein
VWVWMQAAIDITTGLVGIVPLLAIKGYALFALMMGGVVAVEARTLFIWMCPTLLACTKPIVVVINLLLLFLERFVNSAIVVIDAIIVIVNALKSIFGHHHMTNHLLHWVHINSISDHQFRQVVSSIPITCARYDNMPTIFQFLVRYK